MRFLKEYYDGRTSKEPFRPNYNSRRTRQMTSVPELEKLDNLYKELCKLIENSPNELIDTFYTPRDRKVYIYNSFDTIADPVKIYVQIWQTIKNFPSIIIDPTDEYLEYYEEKYNKVPRAVSYNRDAYDALAEAVIDYTKQLKELKRIK